jgi:hypothetical protein
MVSSSQHTKDLSLSLGGSALIYLKFSGFIETDMSGRLRRPFVWNTRALHRTSRRFRSSSGPEPSNEASGMVTGHAVKVARRLMWYPIS